MTSTIPRTDDELPGEEEFMEGASDSVQTAITELHEQGVATTHWVDGHLVRIHPDGRQEQLGELTPR